MLPEQPADLRGREPAHLADVRPHAAPVGAAEQVVVELRRRLPHEGVALGLVAGLTIILDIRAVEPGSDVVEIADWERRLRRKQIERGNTLVLSRKALFGCGG